ncbi:MAG: RecX family transcriptional regulator [Crocinitomicaceae bacterium]|nr:RecX family transcriptional regulator [Crocinitomicaceae bacterium]
MKSERKYSLIEAKFKLEAYCAYQERCSFELEKKMKSWGIDNEDQGRLLAELISSNFLNEERFAEAYVSGKVRIKRWGRIKIRRELKQRHISEYSINKGIASIDLDDYWNNLMFLTLKKWESITNEQDSYKKKAKVYRYLSSKGYETDLLKDAVEEVLGRTKK